MPKKISENLVFDLSCPKLSDAKKWGELPKYFYIRRSSIDLLYAVLETIELLSRFRVSYELKYTPVSKLITGYQNYAEIVYGIKSYVIFFGNLM